MSKRSENGNGWEVSFLLYVSVCVIGILAVAVGALFPSGRWLMLGAALPAWMIGFTQGEAHELQNQLRRLRRMSGESSR